MSKANLSLSKKLDGGYLHVKRRDSNTKNRINKGGYSAYLKSVKGGCDTSSQHKKGGNTNPSQRVVAIKLGGSKKSPKKKKSKGKPKVKDIPANIIPKKHSQVNKPTTKPATKPTTKPATKPATKPKPKGNPVHMPIAKGKLRKRSVTRRTRSNRQGIKKSLTKRRCHDLRKGKRISVTKTRKLTDKDVSKIQSKLKSIKSKTNEEIKKELEQQGLKLSGKSPSILKDIYMYSQLCGINIRRE